MKRIEKFRVMGNKWLILVDEIERKSFSFFSYLSSGNLGVFLLSAGELKLLEDYKRSGLNVLDFLMSRKKKGMRVMIIGAEDHETFIKLTKLLRRRSRGKKIVAIYDPTTLQWEVFSIEADKDVINEIEEMEAGGLIWVREEEV